MRNYEIINITPKFSSEEEREKAMVRTLENLANDYLKLSESENLENESIA